MGMIERILPPWWGQVMPFTFVVRGAILTI
jgi:hypothetical protein